MTRALDNRRDGVPAASPPRPRVPSGMRCIGLKRYWSDELNAYQLAPNRKEANKLIKATLARRGAPTAGDIARARAVRRAGEKARSRWASTGAYVETGT